MPVYFFRLFIFFITFITTALSFDYKSPQLNISINHTELPKDSGSFYVVVNFEPQKGWHLYWQNPGDSGMPPKVEFELPDYAKVSFLGFPPPRLYRKKEITSFVYNEPFSLIYQISTTQHLDPKDVKMDLNWLVCKDTCMPQNHTDTLLNKTVIYLKDAQKKADMLPQDLFEGSVFEKNKKLYISIPTKNPEDIESAYFFPKEQNYSVNDAVQKQILKSNKVLIEVSLLNSKPHVEGLLTIKTKEGEKTYIVDHDLSDEPASDVDESLLILLLSAFLGGLILNLMPCVFPVLSLKILHIMDHVETKRGLIRHGFSYTLGILSTFLTLFLAISILKSAGVSIGWGFQLQSPYFLLMLIIVFITLSLNLFGIFEFANIDDSHHTMHADHSKVRTSFLNGILVTVVATPCTAPFMGTALAVALSQSYMQSLIIFSSLSFGLALPFLILCFYPKGLQFLPKPGNWMKTFKEFLAFPMLGAIIWLLWILEDLKPTYLLPTLCMIFSISFILWIYGKSQFSSNFITTRIIPLILFFTLFLYNSESVILKNIYYSVVILIVGIYAYTLFYIIRTNALKDVIKRIGEIIFAFMISFTFLPVIKSFDSTTEVIQAVPYSEDLIKKSLKNGKAIFINYTARWCITCQMNKINVLSNPKVKQAFKEKGILYVEADWTNRSGEISKSLKEYNRESIPLYVLKVPGAKKPIILPELLTEKIVLEALATIK
ncbi:MAG: thioredoxin family protein [Proteobacteria bacterium]|nr:thioredoxin family protein [Pseudomonadota bacterium]